MAGWSLKSQHALGERKWETVCCSVAGLMAGRHTEQLIERRVWLNFCIDWFLFHVELKRRTLMCLLC